MLSIHKSRSNPFPPPKKKNGRGEAGRCSGGMKRRCCRERKQEKARYERSLELFAIVHAIRAL